MEPSSLALLKVKVNGQTVLKKSKSLTEEGVPAAFARMRRLAPASRFVFLQEAL
jgi:hypothetical protein